MERDYLNLYNDLITQFGKVLYTLDSEIDAKYIYSFALHTILIVSEFRKMWGIDEELHFLSSDQLDQVLYIIRSTDSRIRVVKEDKKHGFGMYLVFLDGNNINPSTLTDDDYKELFGYIGEYGTVKNGEPEMDQEGARYCYSFIALFIDTSYALSLYSMCSVNEISSEFTKLVIKLQNHLMRLHIPVKIAGEIFLYRAGHIEEDESVVIRRSLETESY